MTKKRNLTTFMIAIMIMLFSLPVNAQGTVGYAELKGRTLTFYGGESVPDGAFELNTGEEPPQWGGTLNCTTVVFHESFKDVRPTSCYHWFWGFEILTTIQGIENLNTEEVTNMSGMFSGCSGLTSLDVSKFNTDKVTNMSCMFNYCLGLTSLDLSLFNTAKVTDMSGMFSICKSLSSLDLSSFNTAKVENMSEMFNTCESLSSLDLSSFNTAEVTNMSEMFNTCKSLSSLDLSSFNTAKVENMTNMFADCKGLTTIYVSDDFATGKVGSGSGMFDGCSNLNGYDSNKTDHTMAKCEPGYFTKSNLTPYVKWNGDTKVLTFKVANYIEGTNGEYKLNEGAYAPGWSNTEVYNYCTKVVFTPSFKQVKPTSCCQWFNNFTNLATIQGIENLNTEEVTNMSAMFSGCSGLTSLDLSSFNTDKVTDISNMFNSCWRLTSLDLSSFNTAEVTNMSSMFNECTGLTTIYVSDDFATDKVSNSGNMFYNCTSLKGADQYTSDKLDKSMANYTYGYFTPKIITPYVKWDEDTKVLTFKVANTKEVGSGVYDLNEGANAPGWFIDEVKNNCTKVEFTPSFKPARPTSCYKWFSQFSSLETIEGIENLNTDEVKNMSGMFNGCSGLTSLDVSKFNTAKVENMSSMFNGCSGLTSLDVSKFNTTKVTNMSSMFENCPSLTSLDVSKFNTAKVTNMSNMFNTCSSLTSLDLLSFNTAEVMDMSYMFNGCKGLTSLDLSSFNTAEVKNMSSMFNGCSGLTTIYVCDDFATGNDTSGSDMFLNCTSLVGSAQYDSGKTGKDMANYTSGYFTKSSLTPYVKWNGETNVLTFKVANTKEAENGVYDLNEGANAPGWHIYEVYSNCTKVVFTSSFKQFKPTSCYWWFKDFVRLTTIEGIENLNTEEVTNMSGMFSDCSSLTSLDLSSFNTAKVENMSGMFSRCWYLSSLDLSSFNTAEMTDMGGMFSGCVKLTSLDLSSFNTAKVTNMSYMFQGCTDLKTIYVSDDFTTGNVSSSERMFSDCSSNLKGAAPYDSGNTDKSMANYTSGYFTKSNLTPYVIWNGDTNVLTFKVANYTEGTNGEYKLNEGNDAPGWSIDEVKNNCTNVVFTPSFNHARPTSCCSWFSGFSNLTTIEGIKNLNTEDVTNMSHMFQKCSSLTSLDVSKFNTAKVTNMSDMFNGCSGLTSLDLSSFNTAEVTDMSYMFYGCGGLTSLDLSNFNTAKVTDMSYMFYGCGGLTSLDLTSFNTAEVEYMDYMFGGCENISSLDLSSFNTAKVTNMSGMFDNCSDLTTIYVSDNFNIDKVTFDSYMFLSCSNLVGAASYNPEKTDHTMANYRSGYFKTYFTLGENKVELCGNPLTTNSLNLTGDYDFTPKYEFKANEATYSRDLSSSGSTWFSLCLPFAYTPNNFNFTAYKLNGATANAVEIEEITGEIVAGTPVLFKFKDGVVDKTINLSATDAQIVKAPVEGAKVTGPDGSSLQLCGTYQTKTFSKDADGNAFILLKDKLMNPAKMMLENQNVTTVGVKPFRAYMTLTASAQTSSARAFSIGRGDEGNEGTTAIDLLNSVATDDAEYYDINGRRIDAPAKGVNIVRRGNKTIKLIIK